MKRTTLLALKTLVWLACLWPLGLLLWGAINNKLGADPTATITFATGLATLRLLTISLAITPVRRLSPRLGWLIKFRRLLGLFAKRRYITAGVTAWLLLLPLAATSTNWAIRKLGGKRWNRLHMLVYAAAVCGVIHYWWQVKPGVLTPLAMTIVLGILLLARPVQAWNQRRKVHLV
jgi:sulfoxide reductase heme-binding subunit YedZ